MGRSGGMTRLLWVIHELHRDFPHYTVPTEEDKAKHTVMAGGDE